MGRMTMRTCNLTSWREASLILLALAVMTEYTACENSLTKVIKQDEENQIQLLDFSVSPLAGNWIAGNETIRITFDESLDTRSLDLGGTLGIQESDINIGDWDSETHTNDVLHLDPARIGGLWSEGSRTVIISATSLSGKTLPSRTLAFEVQYAVCVSSDAEAVEDGSIRFPYREVQDGIDAVDVTYPGAGTTVPIRIAVGTYIADCSHGSEWVAGLVEGVSLHGGYTLNFRGLSTTDETVLENSSSPGDGGNFFDPASVLYCGPTVTGNPIIENLTIHHGGIAATSEVRAGVHIEDSSPILRDIVVEGVASSGPPYVIASLVEGNSSPSIINPDFDPGHASKVSIGLYVYNGGAPAVSADIPGTNRISAGSGDEFAAAIVYWGTMSAPGSAGTIDGITIAGPTGKPSGGVHFPNTLGACILFHLLTNTPTITNNVFTMFESPGDDFCAIKEDHEDSDPAVFEGNDFALSSTGVWYLDHDTSTGISGDGDFPCDTTDITFGGATATLVGDTFGNYSSTLEIY